MRPLLLAALAALPACTDEPGWTSVVEPGFIATDSGGPRIVAPTTAQVGAPVTFTIVTDGGSCVEYASTEASLTDAGWEITPLDRRDIPPPSAGCTLLYQAITHTATLTFTLTAPHDLDLVHIAHCYPLTYTDLQR